MRTSLQAHGVRDDAVRHARVGPEDQLHGGALASAFALAEAHVLQILQYRRVARRDVLRQRILQHTILQGLTIEVFRVVKLAEAHVLQVLQRRRAPRRDVLRQHTLQQFSAFKATVRVSGLQGCFTSSRYCSTSALRAVMCSTSLRPETVRMLRHLQLELGGIARHPGTTALPRRVFLCVSPAQPAVDRSTKV